MLARSLSPWFSGVAIASVLARSALHREGVLHRAGGAGASHFVVNEERHGDALDVPAAFFLRGSARGVYAFADPQSAVEYARSCDGVPVPNPFEKDDR